MSKSEHVEPLRDTVMAAVPNLGFGEVLKWLPLLEKLMAAFNTGTGTFSTWTPAGKRWIVVTDKEPAHL